MKKERDRPSRSPERHEKEEDSNSLISPDGSPTHYHYHNNHRGSDSSPNQRQGRPTEPGGVHADNRRTQSERRATHKPGHAPAGRPLNQHVRAARETASLVRSQVKVFARQHLGTSRSNFDFPACTKCLEEEILPGWELTSAEVKDYEDFLKLTLRRETDEDVAGSDEYFDLIHLARRAREFEILIPGCRRRLQTCFDTHAEPHLVSLKHMLPSSTISSSSSPSSTPDHNGENNEDTALRSVDEYDTVATQQAQAVQQKLADLGNIYSSYRQSLKPFTEFVRSGDSHSSQMLQCCKSALEVCKVLEAWAVRDHGYPESLVKEMEHKKNLRDDVQAKIRQTKLEKAEKKEHIKKLLRKESIAARLFTQYRTSRERLRDRLTELRDKDLMLGERIQTKREELQEFQGEREDQAEMSPRRSQATSEESRLVKSIAGLESERKVTRRHIHRVEGDVKPANDRAYENKVEMVTYRHQREETEKEIRRLDAEIVSLRERVARLADVCDKLLLLRELKISPEAYRKGLREMRRHEAGKADGSEDLREACDQAAPVVGSTWRKLYFYLPFDPPRDVEKRQRDITLLDTIASRKDLTDDQVARKSLEKWRSFHRRGRVPELSQALRAIHKAALARKIENSFRAHASNV